MKNKKIFGMAFVAILLISVFSGMNIILLDEDIEVSSRDIGASKSDFNAVGDPGIIIIALDPSSIVEGGDYEISVTENGQDIIEDLYISVCNADHECAHYNNVASPYETTAPFLNEDDGNSASFSVTANRCEDSATAYLTVTKMSCSITSCPSEVKEGEDFSVTVQCPVTGMIVMLEGTESFSSTTGSDGVASFTAPAVVGADDDYTVSVKNPGDNGFVRCNGGTITIKNTKLVVTGVPSSIDEGSSFTASVKDQDGNAQEANLQFSGDNKLFPVKASSYTFYAKEVDENEDHTFTATALDEYLDDCTISVEIIDLVNPITLAVSCVGSVDENTEFSVAVTDSETGDGIEDASVRIGFKTATTGSDGSAILVAPEVLATTTRTVFASKPGCNDGSTSIEVRNIDAEPGALVINAPESVMEHTSFSVSVKDAAGQPITAIVIVRFGSFLGIGSTVTIPKIFVPYVDEDTPATITATAAGYVSAEKTIMIIDDINIEGAVNISGEVYNSVLAEPIEGATVSANGAQDTTICGRYSLQVKIQPNDFGFDVVEITASHPNFFSKSKTLIVVPGGEYTVIFRLIPKHVIIKGKVQKDGQDEPPKALSGASVSTTGASDTTNAFGNYRLMVDPPEEGADTISYVVSVTKAGYRGDEATVTIEEGQKEITVNFVLHPDNNLDQNMNDDVKVADVVDVEIIEVVDETVVDENIVIDNDIIINNDVIIDNDGTKEVDQTTSVKQTQIILDNENTQTTQIGGQLTAAISYAPSSKGVNQVCHFSGSGSGGSGGLSYKWRFGDGSSKSGSSVSHSYSSPDTYTITFTVTDTNGDYVTRTKTIDIYSSSTSTSSAQRSSAPTGVSTSSGSTT